VSQFGGVDETLAFSVERLERFHEVRKRTRVRLVADGFVDRQNLLELVLLLACIAYRPTADFSIHYHCQRSVSSRLVNK